MNDLSADIAARLYAGAQTATRPTAPQEAAGAAQTGSVVDKAAGFVEALAEAEATVAAGLYGRADPQAVVEALAATEIAVQTAVTVRDRVVEAYQEILRMPV